MSFSSLAPASWAWVIKAFSGEFLEKSWLREPDLNRRPSGYEPDELPGCSIPRQLGGKYIDFPIQMQCLLSNKVPDVN